MNRKSEVWFHFSEIKEGKVKCKFCGQSLSVANKSTGPLIRHLKAKHPFHEIKRRDNINNDNTTSNNNSSNDCNNNNNTTANQNVNSPDCTIVTPLQPTISSRRPAPISQHFIKPLSTKKNQEIDRQLIKMICVEYHPFRVVEDPEFIAYSGLLNPSYKLPTRKTVSHSLIPTIYSETVEKIKLRLKRADAICLTTDGWTSRDQDSFFAITAHYIADENNSLVLASDLIGCISFVERHSGENIANMLNDMTEKWEIKNKIIAVTTDNAPNIMSAVRRCCWPSLGCFAHTLNLVVQTALKQIDTMLVKIKKIVRFFIKSSPAQAKLASTLSSMNLPVVKLKNDVPTRWNSTYDMLKRILTIKDAVISTLAVVQSSRAVRDDGNGNVDQLSSTKEYVTYTEVASHTTYPVIWRALILAR